MANTNLIQIKLSDKVVEEMDELQEVCNLSSRTSVIREEHKMFMWLMKQIKAGKNIAMTNKGGKKIESIVSLDMFFPNL